MKGTEKQIKFAEDLATRMNEQFTAIIADCKEKQPALVGEWENIKNVYNKHIGDSYAGSVIDLLASNKETNYQKYYMNLYMSVKHGADGLCKAIRADLPKLYK